MKFGISTFVNDDTIDTVSLARAIEERGFESLVIAEHTHIPLSRESPYPMGGELPSMYYRTLDPFVTLAAAAAVTSRIELITGIALLIQRDPIITAKEAASIDLISGGRFVFGVGAGWKSNPNPVDAMRKRIDQMREGAGRDVALAMFGTPLKPDYWRAVEG